MVSTGERSCVNTGCCTDGCLSERNRDSKEQPRNTDFRTQLLNFGRTVAGAGWIETLQCFRCSEMSLVTVHDEDCTMLGQLHACRLQ